MSALPECDQRKVRRLDMADIPLDLQRRFERRWAARFVRPAALKKQELERQDQQLTDPGKDKRKAHRIKPVGIGSAPAV
jgi:hypothetical protein